MSGIDGTQSPYSETGDHDTPRERARLASIVDLLPRERSSALDIGARDGFITARLASHFQRVTALDLEEPQIKVHNVTSIQGDVTNLEFPDNSFDVVCCFEVLEHIPPSKLGAACSELARVTKHELIVGVPFRQDLRLGRTRCTICGQRNPPWGHMNRFGEGDLARLFPNLVPVSVDFVEQNKARTNWFSAFLDDLAGNPNGTFVPGTRCIFCGNELTPYKTSSISQWLFARLSAVGTRLQTLVSPARPIWIHVVFSKRLAKDHRREAIAIRQIALLGLDFFAKDIARLNNRLQTGWRARVLSFKTKYEGIRSLYDLIRSDLWYTLGMPLENRPMKIAASIVRKPRVIHWVGTDIEIAKRDPRILRQLRGPLITHVTEVEWEVEELRALGIEATIAPLPPRFSPVNEVPPFPSKFTLLTYIPHSRQDFYGRKELEIIIRALSHHGIRFLVVGGANIDAPPGVELHNLGWRNSLDDIYAMSTALLRFTSHDGLSLVVLEALAFGRYVLWTKPFPFVQQVLTVDEICEALERLIVAHQNSELRPQFESTQFIRNTYDPERCVRRIATIWESAVQASKSRPVPWPSRSPIQF